MKRVSYASLTILIAATLISGCALFGKAVQEPHPLEGAWDWSVDTPQGVFTGILTFTEVDDMLSGTIASSQAPEQTALLEELMFDSELSKVTFKYDSGEAGVMHVALTLADDALDGLMNVTQYGVEIPMTCSRKAMME